MQLGGHRNPFVGQGWPSKPLRGPGVAIETPSWARGGHLRGPGVAIETPSWARGGHRNPFVGQGWPSKPLRGPGVAIETPSWARGGVGVAIHRNPFVGQGWPSKPLRGPGVAIETPSWARGGHRNPFVGQGWPSKPLRGPGVAIETPWLFYIAFLYIIDSHSRILLLTKRLSGSHSSIVFKNSLKNLFSIIAKAITKTITFIIIQCTLVQ